MDEEIDFCDVDEPEDADRQLRGRLRVRHGARWAPTFAQLVESRLDCFTIFCDEKAETPPGAPHPAQFSDFVPVIGSDAALAVLTRAYRHDLHSDVATARSIHVNVAYRAVAAGGDVTASSVWDSAIVLGAALIGGTLLIPENAVVVELGAGTGLCGLCAAAAFTAAKEMASRDVFLTDLEGSLAVLRANIDLNRATLRGARVVEHALSWGRTGAEAFGRAVLRPRTTAATNLGAQAPVVLLAADCLLPYNPALLAELADTIIVLLRNFGGRGSIAIVAYEDRFNVDPFYKQLMAVSGASWSPVSPTLLHPDFQAGGSSGLHVIQITVDVTC